MVRQLFARFFLRALTVCCCVLVVSAGTSAAGYKIVRRLQVGGEGAWDGLAVDTDAQRVYITRGSHVMVVDEASGKVTGDIPLTGVKNVHHVAIAPDLGKGYTSNGSAGTVTIFDLKTLKPVSTVKVTGQDPDAIIYDSATKRVFVFNAKTNNATVLDANTAQVVGTVKLSGAPEQAQLDGKGNVFVNIDDKSSMIQFDAKTLAIKSEWPLAPCDGPSALTFDAGHRRFFAACDKMMVVVNADTGKVVASPPIGGDPDGNGYDPTTGLAFASCKEGLISVIHQDSADKYSAVGNVNTQYGTGTMALDPKTHHVFTISADYRTPAKTPDNPKPRPQQIPGSFVLLELAEQ
jgi:DNA-binding beta-propeller fold protein YncE